MSNVLVGLPLQCNPEMESYIIRHIRDAIENVKDVVCLEGVDVFLKKMHEKNSEYGVLVVFDELGTRTRYLPFVDIYKKKHPKTKCIVVVPDTRQGSKYLVELLKKGYYDILFASEFKSKNLFDVFMAPRTMVQAAFYYGVDIPVEESPVANAVLEDEDVINNGSVRYWNGVKIERICAADAKGSGYMQTSDKHVLSFLENGEEELGFCETKMPRYDFDVEEDWVYEYNKKLNEYYITQGLMEFSAFDNGRAKEQDFRKSVRRVMQTYPLSEEQQDRLLDFFIREKKSYGRIDTLINTEGLSDIRLLRPDRVTVQIKGKWYLSNITFGSKEEYGFFINRICTKNHAQLNNLQAEVVFDDISTNPNKRLRFTGKAGILDQDGFPTLHIRTIDKVKKTPMQLVDELYWTKKEAAFLINAIKKGKSIIIGGASGSGKTIGVNCLLEFVPANICGVVLQESGELFSTKETNLEFTNTFTMQGEGKLNHDLKEVATFALLKNAKLFVIGEIKGAEAEDFSTAADTGAQSIATLHSLNVFGILPRLSDLGRGTKGMTQKQLLERNARCIDYVVQMCDYGVQTIAGVVGWDSDREDVIYDIYNF